MPSRPNSIPSIFVRTMKLFQNQAILAFTVACAIASDFAIAVERGAFQPLVIQEQGSFAVGGDVFARPALEVVIPLERHRLRAQPDP